MIQDNNQIKPNVQSLQMAVKRRIKSTCNGCRAYDFVNSIDKNCSLGYNEKFGKPLEHCPKPKTIIQLIDAPKSCA